MCRLIINSMRGNCKLIFSISSSVWCCHSVVECKRCSACGAATCIKESKLFIFNPPSPQRQVDNNPVCPLTCEKEDGKAGSMYSSWAQSFYRPSHTLFLFFSHHQPPTNNTRKGSVLCLDGGVSVLSVLIRCLIQKRA